MLYEQGISFQNFPIRRISKLLINLQIFQPGGNYMLKVNNSRSGVFIVNYEHISHPVLVFLLLTLSW